MQGSHLAPEVTGGTRQAYATLVANLKGRYLLEKWASPNGRRPAKAASLTTQRITSDTIVFLGLGGGEKGDAAAVNVEHFGLLRGRVGRKIGAVLMMDIDVSEGERRVLSARIDWLSRKKAYGITDHRSAARFKPRNPTSALLTEAGSRHDCYVLNVSKTGAAIASDLEPDLGTVLALGSIIGRVVRHVPGGFAMHFVAPQDLETLEVMLHGGAVIKI
ncbi:MAG TPA: PilZ domain-containing protein [Devosiaceae bacterium]|nr:PilZ domain-containing protein [Devosiaceae bacterium]